MKRQFHYGRGARPEPKDEEEDDVPTMNVWISPYKAHIPNTKTAAIERDAQRTLSKLQGLATLPVDKNTSMQVVVRPYLLLGQLFGLIPVCGFSKDDPKDLKFTWKAKRVVYTLALLATAATIFVLQLVGAALRTGFNYNSVDNLVAFAVRMAEVGIFLNQARTWPELIRGWTRIEEKMKHFQPIHHMPMTIKLFIFVFCVGAIGLTVVRVLGPMSRVIDCSDDPWVLLQLTLFIMYTTLFSPPGFFAVKPIIVAALFLQECVVTVYDELTIVILTYCLFLRFRQVNQKLDKLHHQRLPVTYWSEMREIYNDLSQLTKQLDGHLSWMTLVCFGSNLYEICSLLHKILSPVNNELTKLTIIYELVFTMTRTFVAALMASSVFEESKKPLSHLFSVPSSAYNGEICRFQMQVTHDDIALSGCNFFSLTRSFMLTVAGTIATYEIVLLQFNDINDADDAARNRSDICSEIMKKHPLSY